MNYKRHRTIIGNAKNKTTYAESHPRCECCGSMYNLSIHHAIPQQYQYHCERYTIELPENYFTLCMSCHGIIEHNERQYNRELFNIKTFKTYSYWHEMKGDNFPELIIREYLERNINDTV